MRALSLAAGLAVICTLLSTNLLARPSLSSIDAKLDQLLAGQQAILEDIERLRRQLGITLPFCEDLEFSGTIWGQEARGVDLRQYTNSTLHFIGCNGNGCPADSFFCTVDRANLVLTFGTTSSVALRALVDPDDAAGDDMSGNLAGCATASVPTSISNAPDKPEDANALCRALGFASGTVERVNANVCPEPTALDPEGQTWTNDYIASAGYGRVFTCSGVR